MISALRYDFAGLALRFTAADFYTANAEWDANCGPTALAAAAGLTLDEARGAFVDWPGHTNLTTMLAAIAIAKHATLVERRHPLAERVGFHGVPFPICGLARIQFAGRWTEPGVNPRWAYRYTHWIACRTRAGLRSGEPDDQGFIWDVNALSADCDGWLTRADWETQLAPELVAGAGASGVGPATGWYATHSLEVIR